MDDDVILTLLIAVNTVQCMVAELYYKCEAVTWKHFSRTSEAPASEVLENLEEMFSRYWQ